MSKGEYFMQQQNFNVQEKLELDSRKHLFLSGVETVDGFNEQALKLTINGSKVQISGNNIKITAFNKANGNLNADGEFYEIKYMHKKETLIKRIFK